MRRHIASMMIPLLAALVGCGPELAPDPVEASTAAVKSPVLYVNAAATGLGSGASWADAFTDLQSALDAAVAGDEIWVAASPTPYTPSKTIDGSTDPRMASFVLKSGVKLYGGFAGNETKLEGRVLDPAATVLSGDIGTVGVTTDNAYHVVYADGVTDAVFDGFTVTGGRADVNYGGGYGGGMYTRNSLLTVSRCVFSANGAGLAGGGMYNKDSTLTVSDCVFSGNRASKSDYRYDVSYDATVSMGGGMYNEGSYAGGLASSVITGCTFSDNFTASYQPPFAGPLGLYLGNGGAGMYNRESAVTVDRCTFERNQAIGVRSGGGAILNWNVTGNRPTITNSVFEANRAHSAGAAVLNVGPADIVSGTFSRNGVPYAGFPTISTGDGGAIFQVGDGARIVGSIFSRNVTQGIGAAIYFVARYVSSSLTISRCLFHENREGYSSLGNGGVLGHFAPAGWTPDLSNSLLDVDPLLADPDSGDFHLLAGSPAIDAGVTKDQAKLMWPPLPAIATDFDGDKRWLDGDGTGGVAMDIGADEYVNSQDQQ